jgi:hypothetical protein
MKRDLRLSIAQHEPSFADVGDSRDSDPNPVFGSPTMKINKFDP